MPLFGILLHPASPPCQGTDQGDGNRPALAAPLDAQASMNAGPWHD